MNRYTPSQTKTLQRIQIAQQTATYLATGGIIQSVDHTHNESWRNRENDRNNRYTRGDFKRL